MSVSLKQSYDIEYDGTANVARMDLFADTSADLTGLTTVDGITLLQGSTAHVIQTVEDYMMRSNGVWVSQSSGGGGGGSGGDTPVFYTVTPETGVTVFGNPVKVGTKVTWTGQIGFGSSVSGDRLIFTLPAELCPYIKYIFTCGGDDSSTNDIGYILPNGEVHVILSNSKSHVNGVFTWDVITPQYLPTVDNTKVSSVAGGVQVVGNMAVMQISFTVTGISSGWHLELVKIPESIAPNGDRCPFCIYRNRNSAQFLNAYLKNTGYVHIYIDMSLGTTIDMVCIWEV